MKSITIAIPTYKRPSALKKCLENLLIQTHRPDRLICVCRDTDIDTLAMLGNKFMASGGGRVIDVIIVHEEGHLPPIQKALEVFDTDIIAFIDDDAIPEVSWVERIVKGYQANVGGYGGRVINHMPGQSIRYVKSLGHINWFGKIDGSMTDELCSPRILKVDFLNEGNMSFSREALKGFKIDPVLNYGSAKGYGIDLCLSVKSTGFDIIYDPSVVVDHYPQPRFINVERSIDSNFIYEYARNYSYIMLKHSGLCRKFVFLSYFFFIGQQLAPGGALLFFNTRRNTSNRWSLFLASFLGKVKGIELHIRRTLWLRRRATHTARSI